MKIKPSKKQTLSKTKFEFIYKLFNSDLKKKGFRTLKKPEFNGLLTLVTIEKEVMKTLQNLIIKYEEIINDN